MNRCPKCLGANSGIYQFKYLFISVWGLPDGHPTGTNHSQTGGAVILDDLVFFHLKFMELFHLGASDRGIDIRHPVIEADLIMDVVTDFRGTGEMAKFHFDSFIITHYRAALTGGDDLIGIEGNTR